MTVRCSALSNRPSICVTHTHTYTRTKIWGPSWNKRRKDRKSWRVGRSAMKTVSGQDMVGGLRNSRQLWLLALDLRKTKPARSALIRLSGLQKKRKCGTKMKGGCVFGECQVNGEGIGRDMITHISCMYELVKE